MKKIAILAMMIFMVGVTIYAKQDLKIGYVDLQKALNTVEEGKKAKKELEKVFEQKKKELADKERYLRDLKSQIETQGLVISKEAQQKKAEEFRMKYAEFQELLMKYQTEMQQKEFSVTKVILDHLKGIGAKIAKKEGYTMVLEKNEASIIYSIDGLDLTQKVIKQFNAEKKKAKKAKKAKKKKK